MISILSAYAASLVTLLVLDGLWLGVVARPLYVSGIGHLMAPAPRMGVAAVFYLIYAGGLLIFAVMPQAGVPAWRGALLSGALLGALAYATYDLSNLATLRDWPLGLSLIDIAWGAFISALAALAGRWAFDRLSG